MTERARQRAPVRRAFAARLGGVSKKVAGASRPRRPLRPLRPLRPSKDPYRPRDDSRPEDGLDFADRHVCRATDNGKQLTWYLLLLLALAAGATILVIGIAFAVHITGLPPWAVLGIGAGGTSLGAYRGYLKIRRLGDRDVLPPASKDHDDGHGPQSG